MPMMRLINAIVNVDQSDHLQYSDMTFGHRPSTCTLSGWHIQYRHRGFVWLEERTSIKCSTLLFIESGSGWNLVDNWEVTS